MFWRSMAMPTPGRRWVRRKALAAAVVGGAVCGLVLTPVASAAWSPPVYEPYLDVTVEHPEPWTTPSWTTADGAQNAVLASVVSSSTSSCTPSWGEAGAVGAPGTLSIDTVVSQIQALGGEPMLSFGGADDNGDVELANACTDDGDVELANGDCPDPDLTNLENAYESTITRYRIYAIDLDVEQDALNQVVDTCRAQAIAVVQGKLADSGDPLTVWLTLSGRTATGLIESQDFDVINAMLAANVTLAGVNVMAEAFKSTDSSVVSTDAEEALTATHTWLMANTSWSDSATAWQHMGVTVKIGQDDPVGQWWLPISQPAGPLGGPWWFSLSDAQALYQFAGEHGLGRISIWTLKRDYDCQQLPGLAPGQDYPATNYCSGVPQEPLEFSSILGTPPAPPSVSIIAPVDGGTYQLDQAVAAAFTCVDDPKGPGIQSCVDSTGKSSGGTIDTFTAGTHTYTVTATSSDGLSATATIHYTVLLPSAPINTATPAVTGTLARGQTLSITSTWDPAGTSYTYQWQRSTDSGNTWANITDATQATYSPAAKDIGTVLRVQVTAIDSYGQTSATSPATTAIANGAPINTTAPSVLASAQRAVAITVAGDGAWDPAATSYKVQWQRSNDGQSWSNISGASSANYKPVVADEGDYLRAEVSASNKYGKATAASNATTGVSTNAPENSSLPTISGTPQRGSKLTMTSKGTWNGPSLTYTYQWQRSTDATNWTNITGATKTTYTVVVADAGDYLRLAVNAKNVDGTLSAASAASALANGLPPVNTTVPALTGTPQRAATLKATKGTWSGLGNAYSYQWQSSPDGTTWKNITGATKLSYTITLSDEQNEIRMQVTATNPDMSVPAASVPTAAVATVPPVNTTPPKLTGTAKYAKTMTASKGAWTGIGNTYGYQWQNSPDGTTWTNITGATSAKYTLQTSDDGDEVRVEVSATNPDGTVTANSAPSGTVQVPTAGHSARLSS